MIKPEDLRIGDLVMVSNDNCMIPKGALCEVVAIDSERACEDKKGLAGLLQTVREEWEFSHGVWCNNIEGIPLTPKLLEKNGFKVRVSRVYYTKLIGDANFLQRKIAIERKRNDWAVFIRYKKIPDSVLLRHIQHVHELQHILWALGLNAELRA